MGLIDESTRWFFLLPSSKEVEERHVYDVAFGIRILLAKKIQYKDITVFIDMYVKDKVELVFSKIGIPLPSKIYSTSDLEICLENNVYKNAVVFVTGHGSENGLDSVPPITPYKLYEKFQTTINFRRVVFYFGQCYAGIFDYMPLSTHLELSKNTKCNMVAIGSTGLSTSISIPIEVSKVKWVANIFLFYVLHSIFYNKDIDGDGKFTVMDSFKVATINTNRYLKKQIKQSYTESLSQYFTLGVSIQTSESKDIADSYTDSLYLQRLALEKKLKKLDSIDQIPWILNARIAMSTQF